MIFESPYGVVTCRYMCFVPEMVAPQRCRYGAYTGIHAMVGRMVRVAKLRGVSMCY